MKQVIQNLKNGEITLPELPVPRCRPGHVLIKTRKSLISLGTEKMLVEFGQASWIGKAKQQPEKVKQVISKIKTDGLGPTVDAVRNKLDTPMPLGYSNVGVVVEVGEGVTDLQVGDRVVSNGPHAEVVCVPVNLCAKVPAQVSDEDAVFTVVASIGLQGIRLMSPTLGETVVVVGLGLIGLITTQLLLANGCQVIGIDLDEAKVSMARSYGAQAFLSNQTDNVARVMAVSQGRGVDGVIITASTQSDSLISEAAQMCRKRGRVILVGVVGLDLKRSDFYEKEISFQVSCSYGPGRYDPVYEQKGLDYPIGFVRWTEKRNFEAVLDLLKTQRVKFSHLIQKRAQLDESPQIYASLADSAHLGIVLEYSEHVDLSQKTIKLNEPRSEASHVVLGMIGAGQFASAVLLSEFDKEQVRKKYLAGQGGMNVQHQGKKWGFEQITTDYREMLRDPEVNAIVIATRHGSHASLVLEALRAGKNVFVEKPLAIKHEEFREIISFFEEAERPPLLMVGFNRRFSPLVQKMKSLLSSQSLPLSMVMNVNAGAIPANHWVHDSEDGGGRLIGEACHFIDLLRYIADSRIKDSQVMYADTSTKDTFTLSLKFTNGSIGTIHYFANGHADLPKERLGVFKDGKVLALDNFRVLTGHGYTHFKQLKLRSQDKGHEQEVMSFIKAIKNGTSSPIPLEEILEVTQIGLNLALGENPGILKS